MSRWRAPIAAFATVPLVLLSTAADAQRARGTNQSSDAAIAARRECFREAQARFPGPKTLSVANQRTAAYRGCAHRKGVRP